MKFTQNRMKRLVGGHLSFLWVTFFAFAPPASQAEILAAELQVNGLSCPFCAFGIEKKLYRVDGVQEVEVLLDEGRITLEFAEGNRATVRDLDEAVEKAGFELASLRLSVRGRFPNPDADPERFEVHPGLFFHVVAPIDPRKGAGPIAGSAIGSPTTSPARRKTSRGRVPRTKREEGAPHADIRVLTGLVEDRDAEEPRLIPDRVRSFDLERNE